MDWVLLFNWTNHWLQMVRFSYLESSCSYSWTSCIQATMEFLWIAIRHVTGLQMFTIGLKNILDYSNDWFGLLDHPTESHRTFIEYNWKISSCTKSFTGNTFTIMDVYRSSKIQYFNRLPTTCWAHATMSCYTSSSKKRSNTILGGIPWLLTPQYVWYMMLHESYKWFIWTYVNDMMIKQMKLNRNKTFFMYVILLL